MSTICGGISPFVVDNLNIVTEAEKDVFLNVLNNNKIEYTHFSNLKDTLKYSLDNAAANDTILLIGAQGMDPAENILEQIL